MVVRELLTRWRFKPDSEKVKKFNNRVNQVKKTMAKAGLTADRFRQGLKRIGLAVAAVGVIAVKSFADFDAALKNTLTLTDAEGAAFDELEAGMAAKAFELSKKLGIAAKDVATGFYQVLSTGAEALSPQFNNLAEVALKMAKTVGLEPADAIEKLNDTLKAFRLPAESFVEVADKMFVTSKLAATTVPQLAEALKQAGPIAADANISLSDTLAILAGWAEVGTKGAEAGMAFRQVLTKLRAPSTEGKKALKDLKTEVFETDGTMRKILPILMDMQEGMKNLSDEEKAVALKAIAGEEALARLSALLGKDLKQLGEWSKKLDKAQKALDKAFNIKMRAATEQMKLYIIQLQTIAIEIGGKLMPMINDLLGGFVKWAKDMKGVIGGNKNLVETVKPVITILGQLLKTLGGVIKSWALLFKMHPTLMRVLGGAATLAAIAAFASPMAALLVTVLALAAAVDAMLEALDAWAARTERIAAASLQSTQNLREIRKILNLQRRIEQEPDPAKRKKLKERLRKLRKEQREKRGIDDRGSFLQTPSLDFPEPALATSTLASVSQTNSGSIAFNIYGATDPMRVAKQVERIMDKREEANARLLSAQLGVTV